MGPMATADRLFDERFEGWLGARGAVRARVLEPTYAELARPVAAPPDVVRTVAVLRCLIGRGRDGLLCTERGRFPATEAGVLFSHLEECGWFTSSGGRALPSPLLRRLDAHPRALWAVVADGLLVRSDGFGSSAEPVFASLLRFGGLPGLESDVADLTTARVLRLVGAFGGWARHGKEPRLSPGGRATLRRALRASVLSPRPRTTCIKGRDLVDARY